MAAATSLSVGAVGALTVSLVSGVVTTYIASLRGPSVLLLIPLLV